MAQTKEVLTEQIRAREIPTENLLRPLILNRGKVLLMQDKPERVSKYLPPRWEFPRIRISGGEDFTKEELSHLIQSRLGIKVSAGKTIKEKEDISLSGHNSSKMRDRVISFECRRKRGRVNIDPKLHRRFAWVAIDKLGDLALDSWTHSVMEEFLNRKGEND